MQGKKLKVLFLVNIPSPYRVDFFNELGKHCELTVLFEKDNSKEREGNWYNNNFINFNGIFVNKEENTKTFSFLTVIKYLNRNLFDFFIIGGYSTPIGMIAIELLKIKRIPFILNTDGGMVKHEKKFKRAIKRYFISSASYWLSTGNQTTDYLVYYGAMEENTFKYPFTSLSEDDILVKPVQKSVKNELRLKLRINEEKVILSIGRFIDIKGFDTLMKASKSLPENYGVYIVGGKPTSEYIKLKNELNLANVHFIGFKSKDELKEFYLASDIFVLPTRGDIWGLVINEAMANGLPIVTTDKCVAGLELVSDNENGYIVPVNDNNSLVERITGVLDNPKTIEKMSNCSLEKIKSYTVENMAKVHLDIFNRILSKENKYGNK